MATVKELLKAEEQGGLSFGDYTLAQKTKLSDFAYQDAVYKVKTFQEITRLEKNGGVVYESVPGSAVHDFKADEKVVTFSVEAPDDIQITLELEPATEYKVYVDDMNIGHMKTNLGGKINFSIELNPDQIAKVKVVKL